MTDAKVQGLVLAAGDGSRLRPDLPDGLPKQHLLVHGERIIERLLRQLTHAKVDNIHVVIPRASRPWQKLLRNYPAVTPVFTTKHGKAADLVEGLLRLASSRTVLVAMGDCVYGDQDILDFVRQSRLARSSSVLVGVRADRSHRAKSFAFSRPVRLSKLASSDAWPSAGVYALDAPAQKRVVAVWDAKETSITRLVDRAICAGCVAEISALLHAHDINTIEDHRRCLDALR